MKLATISPKRLLYTTSRVLTPLISGRTGIFKRFYQRFKLAATNKLFIFRVSSQYTRSLEIDFKQCKSYLLAKSELSYRLILKHT